MVGEKEGAGSELDFQKTVVLKILKLFGLLVEPLEEANVTIWVLEQRVEPIRAEVKRVILFP